MKFYTKFSQLNNNSTRNKGTSLKRPVPIAVELSS